MSPCERTFQRSWLPGALLLAGGFALAWAACAALPQLYYTESFPLFRRQQLPASTLFDPARAAQPKHAFVGASYMINAWIKNDLDTPGWPSLEDPGSSYAATARLAAQREFDAPGQGFYDLGRLGAGFLEHLWYLNQGLRAANLKTVVYATGHTNMTHFADTPWTDVERSCLETAYILGQWRVRYPSAAQAIDAYDALLKASPAYAAALARFGADWRSRLDEAQVFLNDRPLQSLVNAATNRNANRSAAGVRGNPHLAVNKPAELRDALIWKASLLSRFGSDSRQRRTLSLLDQAGAILGDPRLDAPVKLNPSVDPFAGPEAEASRAWARMVGEVLRAAGVTLVWFFPPEVSVTPADYERYYRPGFVDAVRAIIVPMGHMVSDHVVDHGLNQREFVMETDSPPHQTGYKPGSVGKLKAVRLLLADMTRGGAFPGRLADGAGTGLGTPGALGSCWPGEARLPDVAFCVRAYSPDNAGGSGGCVPWPRPGAGAIQ